MPKKLVISHLLNRVYYGSISKDGLIGKDRKDLTDEFRFCVLEYLKKTDDKNFKEEVRKLILPGSNDPTYYGPTIYCPHCKKEITVDWLKEDMEENNDMLILYGQYETECPGCQSTLEFMLDGFNVYTSIGVKFLRLNIKEPCEQCGDMEEPELLEIIDGKKLCCICKIKKEKKAKKTVKKEACEQCRNKFEKEELKMLNGRNLCPWCYKIRQRRDEDLKQEQEYQARKNEKRDAELKEELKE